MICPAAGEPGAVSDADETMHTVRDLDEIVELVGRFPPDEELYVRWSRGPAVDVGEGNTAASRDSLTGVPLPGLSGNPLAVEPAT